MTDKNVGVVECALKVVKRSGVGWLCRVIVAVIVYTTDQPLVTDRDQPVAKVRQG